MSYTKRYIDELNEKGINVFDESTIDSEYDYEYVIYLKKKKQEEIEQMELEFHKKGKLYE